MASRRRVAFAFPTIRFLLLVVASLGAVLGIGGRASGWFTGFNLSTYSVFNGHYIRVNLYAKFNVPTDTVIAALYFSRIDDDPVPVFFHSDLLATAPCSETSGSWDPVIPNGSGTCAPGTSWDSCLSIGNGPLNSTAADGGWGAEGFAQAQIPFGAPGSVDSGPGWFNPNTANQQGQAGPGGSVYLGTFAMRNGSGRARFLLTLAYNNGDGGPVAFATGSFELNACLVAAPDLDGDGFGAGPGTISPSSCELPAGFAWRIDDCAPNDPARHPNSVWYRDNDGDGIGAAADGTLQNCVGAAGYTLIGGDNCPQLPNPDQQDCDSDDLGDACEFAFGNETDLDGNSVPDSCELLVGGSGFSSIQAAIAAAPDGSTILVAPGTHAPFEVTGRRLTIRGLDAARRPIVHGLGAARCATISLAQNGPVRLEHLEFADGAAGNGGGINALLSELELIHCVFRGCAADAEGGGVALYASAARIENCRFESNHAQDGGALFATGSFSPDHPTEIVATRFVLNSAGSVGGAIASRTAILVDDCEFASNDAATLGGGIWSSSKSATSVRASGFCDNAPLDWFGPIVDLGSNVFGPDCDANRACDLGEIAADPSLDTNQNAELDDCERSRGDLNLDGTVNGADLALLLNRWGNIGDSEADLNGDGIVNASDLSLLLNGWSS